jgi:exosortase
LGIAIYWPNAIDLVRLWTGDNPEYSHGLLLMLVALWLTALRWARERPRLLFSWFGTLAIAVLASIWAVAHRFDIMTGERLAFVLMPLAIMWSTLGLRGVLQVGLPMGLIIFAIPLWSVLNLLLQPMTAHAVSFMMDLVGVPSVAEATMVLIPAGTFRIAENCTGLRQLVVAMPLALIFAEVTRLRMPYPMILLGASIVLSFLLNCIRIFVVVLSGQLTTMQHYFVTEDHVGLGWLIFAVGVAGFFFAASKLIPERWHRPQDRSPGIPVPTQDIDSTGLLATRLAVIPLSLALGPVLVQMPTLAPR